jgi:hypothetical protein
MLNTPIQEGFSLSTSSNSFAEVEFENGSTARLGELSKMDFTQLALAASGDKLNHLALEEGYATFHFAPEQADVYAVKVANTTITPRGKAEFRTNFNQGSLQVEVFDGAVAVEGPAGSAKLGKDKVLDYDTQTTQAFNVRQGIQKDDWDNWVEARDRQSLLAFNESAVGRKSHLYGWSDLDTYGEWAYFPGHGYGWTPYAPLGWRPYSLGRWCWYPGIGWTWISDDPWGWLPYHYGFWDFDAAFGWFWMPGAFDFWSPALVTWYQGPGWLGWAPAGTPAGGGVTAVPPGTVQGGQPITPITVLPPPPRRGKPIPAPPSPASRLAMLGGTPLPGNVILPTNWRAGTAGPAGARPAPAPPTVLMGGDPNAERAQLAAHEGFWGHAAHALGASAPHPLHARLGTTLGGRFPVAQNSGERVKGAARGPDRIGGRMGNRSLAGNAPRGSERSAPVLLPHGSARVSFEGGRMTGGGFSASASGSGSASSATSSASTVSPSASSSSAKGSGGVSHH